MIFAAPRPISEGDSGSMMRMCAMRAAFRALGYEVEEISGPLEQRMAAMARVRRRLAEGVRYDLAYFENHTIPLHMTAPRLRLLRRYPLADLRFFYACRRHGVPIGVFYRDAWWRFEAYRRSTSTARRWLRHPLYWLELLIYARSIDVLYVPHPAMAAALPLRPHRVEALPPGTSPELSSLPAPPPLEDELRLFYVGGIGSFYRLSNLLEAVQRTSGVKLTICCRPHEWQSCRESYRPVLSERVQIVHAYGADLLPYFAAAHVLSCFMAPDPYWRVTVPIKLFEYLGAGRPILAADGTNAGTFVTQNEVGWAVDDDPHAMAQLLERLKAAPEELAAKAARAREIAPEHSWEARARQVVEDLRPHKPAHAASRPGAQPATFEQRKI